MIKKIPADKKHPEYGVLGSFTSGKGQISVIGDSSLFDDGQPRGTSAGGQEAEGLLKLLRKNFQEGTSSGQPLKEDFKSDMTPAVRPKGVNFAPFSNVVGKEPFCGCRTPKKFRSKGQPCVAAATPQELSDFIEGTSVKIAHSSSIDWEKNPKPKSTNLFDKLGLNGERGSSGTMLHQPKKTPPAKETEASNLHIMEKITSQHMVKLPHLDNQMSLIMGSGGFVLILLLWRLSAQSKPGARRVTRAGRRLPVSTV